MPEKDDLQETPAKREPVCGRVIEPADIAKLRQRPALSESELIEHALRYANTGSLRSYTALTEATDSHVPDAPELVNHAEHQAFRAALKAIVSQEAIPAWLLALWERRANALLLLPTIKMHGGKRHMTYRQIVFEFFDTTPAAPLAHVLLLFLDSEKPYGRDLCQCRLESCGKFFFADRTQANRPRTRFCSEPHYEEAHNAEAAERVRRSRERRRRAAKHK